MKKYILISLTVILTFSFILSGCGNNEKLKDDSIKSGDETVSIKIDNGDIVAGDDVEWPENNMGDIAKPNSKITAVLKDDTTGNCTVVFSDMDKEDAVQYVEELKKLGYQPIMEVNDADEVMFSGKNSKEVMATFTYNNTAKEGSVSYIPNPSDDIGTLNDSENNNSNVDSKDDSVNSSSVIDMTDVSPWPSDLIFGLPELNGKIIDVINQNDETITIELEYVEKSDFESFLSNVKNSGFTVDSDEVKSASSYEYFAYNQNGDTIILDMTYESKTVSVYVEKAAPNEE